MQDSDEIQDVVEQPVQQEAEEIQQPEATSTSNQSTDEVSAATPDQGSEEVQPSNPRTEKRIQELLEENKRLKAQQGNPGYGKSVFDSFHTPQGLEAQPTPQANFDFLNQAQVEAIATQFVDQEGNVDLNGLNRALSDANSRAAQAESRAKQTEERLTRFEENQQQRRAIEKHPDFDPTNSDQFDDELFRQVSKELFYRKYEGTEDLSDPDYLLKVVEQVKKTYHPNSPVDVAKVEEAAVAKFKQSQQSRNQGPIEQGRGAPRNPDNDINDLRERSRAGDEDALMERLRIATEKER